ncbi:hypothetical protein GCM10011360_25250 [Primorskyibacter flagellatus]|uniref:Uncharacterized protein n=2 Tax=Primorskyibacter flagellatus TaxID=1387277 RepID=A0A917EGA3_9RHOB|nr:hypothetical protein GCM10011360_25250 [Primorskyibacter flagellatus]
MFPLMTRILHILGLCAVFLAAPVVAQAACTAEYKAKQDNPLRLQHGEMQVSSCDPSAAAAEVQARLAQQGWILLKIVSLKG